MAETPEKTMTKRGYSRDFRVTEHDDRCRYLLDKIPVTLWTKVRDQAKAEGVSIRGLLLTLLTQWTEDDDA
jgi:hypothetical protein